MTARKRGEAASRAAPRKRGVDSESVAATIEGAAKPRGRVLPATSRRRKGTAPVRAGRAEKAGRAATPADGGATTNRRGKAATPHDRARQRRRALLAVSESVRRGTRVGDRSRPANARKGKKALTIFLHPLAKSLIDSIAYQTGASRQDLGIEAINLLFMAYDRKPIA